jgi:hypothetical protein
LKIHANQAWNAGGRQLLSLKTPTCLLLDGRKQIVSFGYEAENDYAELALDEKHFVASKTYNNVNHCFEKQK